MWRRNREGPDVGNNTQISIRYCSSPTRTRARTGQGNAGNEGVLLNQFPGHHRQRLSIHLCFREQRGGDLLELCGVVAVLGKHAFVPRLELPQS